MAEVKASTVQPGNANRIAAAGNPAQPMQEKTLSLRLNPVNNSDFNSAPEQVAWIRLTCV